MATFNGDNGHSLAGRFPNGDPLISRPFTCQSAVGRERAVELRIAKTSAAHSQIALHFTKREVIRCKRYDLTSKTSWRTIEWAWVRKCGAHQTFRGAICHGDACVWREKRARSGTRRVVMSTRVRLKF